jgi:L-asparaginase
MAKSKIHFILTGGTIDSYYEGTKDTAVPNEHSVIPRFIRSLKLYEEFEFSEICMKDSRDLAKADLRMICETIEKSSHKRIIITHGTYTMPETARYIESNLKIKDKVIIFTGSMVPLAGFSPSDAPFNLGFSIAKSQELHNGVYVCMNGRVFSAKEVFAPKVAVRKISEGRFSSIFNK